MAENTLGLIRAAEEKAAAIKADGAERARSVASRAEHDGQKVVEDAEKSATEKAAAIRADAKAVADKRTAELRELARRDADELLENAKSKNDAAIKLIKTALFESVR